MREKPAKCDGSGDKITNLTEVEPLNKQLVL